MTRRTHAVAKTRAHQVRWSSRCRPRAEGRPGGRGGQFGAGPPATATAAAAAGARVAAARGRCREARLRLPPATATRVGAGPTRQRCSHALLRPQKGELVQPFSFIFVFDIFENYWGMFWSFRALLCFGSLKLSSLRVRSLAVLVLGLGDAD